MNEDLRKKYREAMETIERYYAFPRKHQEIMRIIPLVRNGIFLLYGYYGYGKTVYADIIGKVVFGTASYGKVNLNNELGIHDVFFWLDAGKLAKGQEVVNPRSIITSHFKFINEVQRGNSRIYNALLSLMSEGRIVYRDQVFETPDYVMLMDANPADSASSEIPKALLDRVTGSFTMVQIHEEDREKLMYLTDSRPIDKLDTMLTYEEMKKIWEDVESVRIPSSLKFFLTVLVHNYINKCVKVDKEYLTPEVMRNLCDNCRWKSEPCSQVMNPLGQRWWIDTFRIARARAYFKGRDEVEYEDILFSLRYTIPHRILLRDDILMASVSPELWAENFVGTVDLEFRTRWLPALEGDKAAREESSRIMVFLEVEKDGSGRGIR